MRQRENGTGSFIDGWTSPRRWSHSHSPAPKGNQTNLSRFLSLAVVVGSVVSAAHGQCQYEVTIIQAPDCPPFGSSPTRGTGINELGHVVGFYTQCGLGPDEAFLWTPSGGLVTLPRPPGISAAIATDINDTGVIVGRAQRTGTGRRGFVYDTKSGDWTELPPVIEDGNGWSEATAINNAGQVVGYRSIGPDVNPQNAFIWSAKVGFTDLGVMTGPNSSAMSISETGLVAGWTGTIQVLNSLGFLFEDEDITALGPVPGGVTSVPYSVSESGHLVGAGLLPPSKALPIGATRAFLWHEGVFAMLGTLPEHLRSAALDLRGDPLQVVGVSWTVDGNPNISHGFVWQNNVMTNLDDLLPPELGLTIREANAINEITGQIVADGSGDAVSGLATFLLTPVPGPPGDLDLDCRVDVLDLLELLKSWGPCPAGGDCGADLNGDATVNCLDLLILLDSWS